MGVWQMAMELVRLLHAPGSRLFSRALITLQAHMHKTGCICGAIASRAMLLYPCLCDNTIGIPIMHGLSGEFLSNKDLLMQHQECFSQMGPLQD